MEIQRHGGTYNWNSEGMGFFREMHLQTDDAAAESKIQDEH